MRDILATYRVQVHRDFRIADAAELACYLHELGISHIYTSPVLKARRRSTHGYDVVDPTCLNPEIGDEGDRIRFVDTLHQRNMGWMVDIVPNHMAAGPDNYRWESVLTHGRSSPYADWFDIDWRSPDRELRGRVLIPVLGDQRARVLRRNELELSYGEGVFRVKYHEHSFPSDPATSPAVLKSAIETVRAELGGEDPGLRELQRILRALASLPNHNTRNARRAAERVARCEALAGELATLTAELPRLRGHLESAARSFPTGPDGPRRMQNFLRRQVYRLVYWRRAGREINYRRFFDINDLIALRMEVPHVFEEAHSLILRWVGDAQVDALRIDHIDGLLDPRRYLEQLSSCAGGAAGASHAFPVYVEKILSPHSQLRTHWPVAGTTGYDFLNQAECLFIDPTGADIIRSFYDRAVFRSPMKGRAVAERAKRRILRSRLSAYLHSLARRLVELSRTAGEWTPQLTLAECSEAIAEFIACLPVYRTYIDAQSVGPDEADAALIGQAARKARRGLHEKDTIHFLEWVLTGVRSEVTHREFENQRLRFVQRLQQLSGPAAAKGIEDTTFYVYVPLLSRNEVGAEPWLAIETALADFHRANADRAAHWPRTLLTVTTHDTKRSADVRARLDVLSECPADWQRQVSGWQKRNRRHRSRHRGRLVPDANTEYLLYQTLVGIWPSAQADSPNQARLDELRERAGAYMLKAAREAKQQTSWINPNAAFEDGLRDFVDALFADEKFRAELTQFTSGIARAGLWNALARTVIHLTSPGVPDIYQGDEMWNFTLVDPDNRRSVDYDRRRRSLAAIRAGWNATTERRGELLSELLATPEDGRLKLFLIWRCLQTRAEHASLFLGGAYAPLEAFGAQAEHVIAFARTRNEDAAVAVAPRLTLGLTGASREPPLGNEFRAETLVQLPDALRDRTWRCTFTGREVKHSAQGQLTGLPVASLLQHFPVALLIAKP